MDALKPAQLNERRGLPNWTRPAAPCFGTEPALRRSQMVQDSISELSQSNGKCRGRSVKLPYRTLTAQRYWMERLPQLHSPVCKSRQIKAARRPMAGRRLHGTYQQFRPQRLAALPTDCRSTTLPSSASECRTCACDRGRRGVAEKEVLRVSHVLITLRRQYR